MSYPVSPGPDPTPPGFPPGRPPWEQPSSAPPPQPSRNSGLLVGLIAAVVVLICAVCGVGGYFATNSDDSGPDTVTATPRVTTGKTKASGGGGEEKTSKPHKVRYEVKGKGKILATWSAFGGSNDNQDATAPWSKEVTLNEGDGGLKLTAYGKDAGGGTPIDQGLSCKIFIDGDEAASRTGTSSVECTADFS